MREMLNPTSAIAGGAWIFGGADYRRTFFRCKPRRVDRPMYRRKQRSGDVALVEEGDLIKINIPELKLELAVSDEELLARKAKWQPRRAEGDDRILKAVRIARDFGQPWSDTGAPGRTVG